MHLSDIHVPQYVWREEPGTSAEIPALSRGHTPENWLPTDYDPVAADREIGPRLQPQKRQVRVLWEEEFRRGNRIAPLVVIGGPGFGKTSLLVWTTRTMALDGKAKIENRTATYEEIHWPILVDLDTWARQLGRPLESLRAVMLERAGLPEAWSNRRRELLERVITERLKDHAANTFLFLDALDQVIEARAQVLRNRLDELSSLAPQMVLSSRESGLRVHQGTLPFPHVTTLQVAALLPEDARHLATMWLGATRATQLDGYLRSHSSLTSVAESPLLLTLACLVASTHPECAFPETAAALYREILRRLALGAWRATSGAPLAVEDVDAFLGALRHTVWSLYTVHPGANQFGRETLIDAMVRETGATLRQANQELLRLVDLGFLESSGYQDGELLFQFRHSTFREFLASWHLAFKINRDGWGRAEVAFKNADGLWIKAKARELLDTHAFEPTWEPLFVFTAGMLTRPAEFFEMLADSGKDDHFRNRLSLLCRCYGTLSPDKESVLKSVMEPVFKVIGVNGRKAAIRKPDRWRPWLGDISSLMVLPVAGREIAIRFVEMGQHEHHQMRMLNFGHDLVELLAKTARGLQSAFESLRSSQRDIRENWQAVETVAFGTTASRVLKLAEELLAVGKPSFRPWHIFLRELDKRGWRIRIGGDRKLEVLRAGQEEPRPDANFGW